MELARKLQLKPGMSLRLLNAPRDLTLDLPVDPRAKSFLLFAASRAELATHAPRLLSQASDDDLVWIAYPKKTGSIKTDIDRDHGWDPVTDAGWEGVRLVAVDQTWSAMRFRPVAR